MKRLAVVFPGIGYTADKPLLHYGRRLAERFGYETQVLAYGGFPKKIGGDKDKLQQCCEIALKQAEEQLADIDLLSYDDVLFIGKSIGTVAAAELAAHSPARERIRLLLYTPLEETFAFPLGDAVVFTGGGDPWVGGSEGRIPALCRERQIPCFVIEEANHSLETADPLRDVRNLEQIMHDSDAFIRAEQLRRIRYYETLLQELRQALARPDAEELPALRAKAEELGEYLGSEDWKRDFSDEETGLLPRDMPRGVLSEDGLYNALEAFREQLAEAEERQGENWHDKG